MPAAYTPHPPVQQAEAPGSGRPPNSSCAQERDPRQLLGSLQRALHSKGAPMDHALFVPLDSSSFTVASKGPPGSPRPSTWDWPLAMQQAWAAGSSRRSLPQVAAARRTWAGCRLRSVVVPLQVGLHTQLLLEESRTADAVLTPVRCRARLWQGRCPCCPQQLAWWLRAAPPVQWCPASARQWPGCGPVSPAGSSSVCR